MTSAEPVDYRMIIAVRHADITEDTMFYSLFQRFCHGWGCTKIHIGYPHWQYVGIIGRIPFIRVRTPAWNDFIKIVFNA
jgi:hypothetical protein